MNSTPIHGPGTDEREARAGGAVVFDCDGLLLDTEECWTDAERALFAEHGRPYGPEEKRLLLGAGPGAAGRVLAAAFGLPGREAALFARLLELATARVVGKARPMPGAEGLLHRLSGTLQLGVASNSQRALLESALGGAGLLGHFDAVVGSDEVEGEKPAPDPSTCSRAGAWAPIPPSPSPWKTRGRGSPPPARRGCPWSASRR